MPVRVAKSDAGGSARELGFEAFRSKRWLEAINLLGSALDNDHTDAEAVHAIAVAHNALGDPKTARAMLGRAIKADPDFGDAHRDMAILLGNEGRSLEAAEHACRAVEIEPSNRESLELLGRIRGMVCAMKPSAKKKTKKDGHSQAEIDAWLARINSTLRHAAWAAEAEASAAGRPTISLCVIARNEEEYLDGCLASVKGVVDEVVLLDTGSTDRTVEIARSHGAAVHRSEWPNSYAEARNEALQHATSDWILVLDADELLDRDSKNLILRAVRKPDHDAYVLFFRNYVTTGKNPEYFVHRTCRLFRNRPEYRYVGRVHERIVSSIENSGGKVGEIEAIIHHFGYRPDVMEDREKHQKYVQLLLADLREHPTDAFCLYNLGAAYSTHGDHEDARIYLEMAAEIVTPAHEFAASTFVRLAKAYCEIGKPDQAVAALDRAEAKEIRHPELYFYRGSALLGLKRYEQAIGALQYAILEGAKQSWLGDPGAYGYKAYYGIAQAYIALGSYKQAVEACDRALAQNPDDSEVHELLGTAYVALNRPHDAERHLAQSLRLNPDSALTAVRLADVYEQQKRYREAKAKYAEALGAGYETPELRFKLGLCMHRSSDFACAEENYRRATELRVEYPQAHTALGILYAEQEQLPEALQAFAAAVDADPTYSEAYFNAADVLYSAEKYAEAADIYQSGLAYDAANARGFVAMGNCYFRMAAYEAAAMAYREALALQPNYPEAMRNLAEAERATLPKAA